MQNRFAFVIASIATLLLLLVGFGVAFIFNDGQEASVPNGYSPGATTSGTVQAEPVSDQPSIEQQVQSLIDSREAAYRQALDDANSKLKQANAQLEQAYAIIDSLRKAATPDATPTPVSQPAQQDQPNQAEQPVQPSQADSAASYAVSPDEAAAIALVIEPGGRLIKTPDLVSFQGTPAYEVQLDLGIVYVDANSRSVLYDATAPAQVTVGTSPSRSQEDNGGDDD